MQIMINKEHIIIKVLDKGFVKLCDYMGDDHRISQVARLVEEDWRGEADEKLIRYMLKNGHTSPFEHVVLTVHIKCPIFVARQWHRHRTWSYNEISARYKPLPEEYYIPDPKVVGVQSGNNHQARVIEGEDEYGIGDATTNIIHDVCKQAFQMYHSMLDAGVPREIARSVLPMGTYTEYYGTIDAHNLMDFIRKRAHWHAQYEIQQYAVALLKCMRIVLPFTTSVFCSTLEAEKYPILEQKQELQ